MTTGVESILSIELPFNEKLAFYSVSFGEGGVEVAVASGFYGDEHNGMYVCHKLVQFLREVAEGKNCGWKLKGRVRVLPALNPLGTLTDRRYWPFDNRDINVSFPGVPSGETTERIAASVLTALRSCRYCIDLHSGARFFNELPQVRLYEAVQAPMEQAAAFDLPIIWRRITTPLLSGSLAHNLNERGVPTFIVHFGSANRINKFFCQWVFVGILKFLRTVGVLEGDGPELEFTPVGLEHLKSGRTVTPDQEYRVLSKESGLFVADSRVGDVLEKDRPIGRIIDPVGGREVSVVASPRAGVLFTLRTNPVVYEGTLLARVAG
ncbi:succinylglutamate desuccinylase/aspartoacylase family protein [bacterium]|nr:succinylglutamate desuccinylase/aspartoacylase family protein [bacterium]